MLHINMTKSVIETIPVRFNFARQHHLLVTCNMEQARKDTDIVSLKKFTTIHLLKYHV